MSGAKNAPTRLPRRLYKAVTKLHHNAIRSRSPLAEDLAAILQHAVFVPRRRRGRALFGGAS